MPRFARVVVAGCPHHITHRGNRRDDIFFSDADREEYLDIMLNYSRRYDVQILGYCLMSSHAHLLCIPEKIDSLALAIGRVQMKYARYANKRQQWSGHLWANRFYSTPLDEAYCWNTMKYIERNPVRAGLVKQAWDYRWSSARAHVLGVADPLLTPCPQPPLVAPGEDWGRWLAEEQDEAEIKEIRANTYTGWPTGSPEFVEQLEKQLQRRLTRQTAGRKAKQKGI